MKNGFLITGYFERFTLIENVLVMFIRICWLSLLINNLHEAVYNSDTPVGVLQCERAGE